MNLTELHNLLWTETRDTFRTFWSTNVALTEDEWESVKALVVDQGFPVTIGGGNPGLGGLSLVILTAPPIPQASPELLCRIKDDQLPDVPRRSPGGRERVAMELLKPLVDTPRNRELLQWYGLSLPNFDPSHYEY